MRPFQPAAAQKGSYPPDTEYNHISPDVLGPLKANWSLPCPAGLSRAQQEGACVSLQESVWGAPTLARLEAIKAKVDPQHLFSCHRCVGTP